MLTRRKFIKYAGIAVGSAIGVVGIADYLDDKKLNGSIFYKQKSVQKEEDLPKKYNDSKEEVPEEVKESLIKIEPFPIPEAEGKGFYVAERISGPENKKERALPIIVKIEKNILDNLPGGKGYSRFDLTTEDDKFLNGGIAEIYDFETERGSLATFKNGYTNRDLKEGVYKMKVSVYVKKGDPNEEIIYADEGRWKVHPRNFLSAYQLGMIDDLELEKHMELVEYTEVKDYIEDLSEIATFKYVPTAPGIERI